MSMQEYRYKLTGDTSCGYIYTSMLLLIYRMELVGSENDRLASTMNL